MPTVKQVAILNIDNVPYAVDTMSKEVQTLVGTFNEWNQVLANKQQELQMFSVSLEALQQQIIAQIKKEKDEAAAPAELTADSTTTADSTAKE